MARRRGVATTWWGKRWTGALEALGATWRNRLPRGRIYAREGRVVGLTVESGRVSAYVVGRLPRPYQVVIALRPLTDRQWRHVIAHLVSRAGYAARLLAAEMPDDIEEAFEAAKVSLFPRRPEDLKLSCSCADLAVPCKHGAATHYALGEAFDYDPFLLFALRGRDREAVLAALRSERTRALGGAAVSGPASGPGESSAAREAPAPSGVEAEDGVATEAQLAAGDAAEDIDLADFGAWRVNIDHLRFRIEPPRVRMAVLKSLGKPPGWRDRASLAGSLDHVYAAASDLAQRIALGEREDDAGKNAGDGSGDGSGDR